MQPYATHGFIILLTGTGKPLGISGASSIIYLPMFYFAVKKKNNPGFTIIYRYDYNILGILTIIYHHFKGQSRRRLSRGPLDLSRAELAMRRLP